MNEAVLTKEDQDILVCFIEETFKAWQIAHPNNDCSIKNYYPKDIYQLYVKLGGKL